MSKTESLLRAGRVMAGAMFHRTGPRSGWRDRRFGVLALASAGLLGGAAVAATGVATTGAAPVDAGERAKIEAIVRDYILAHPEIIPQAIQKLRDQQLAGTVAENRSALETPYGSAWEGAEKPDVVLVEFFDYACGYCRASLPAIDRLLAEDKGLRVVYRELPIITEGSADAARLSLAIAKAGKDYPALHRALYAAGGVERDKLIAVAQKAGLSRAAAEAALADKSHDAEIAGNIRLAQALEANGTPVFVVGDKVMQGAVGYEALKDAIAAVRAKAGG